MKKGTVVWNGVSDRKLSREKLLKALRQSVKEGERWCWVSIILGFTLLVSLMGLLTILGRVYGWEG
ncbi:hypothetical protein LCGC14_2525620 [marine sediment metagenome]|uniref:Uncharacterized protein n=1 Tax=marine sediment metagenome TaxID=412755 RepID=A0A0F9AV30_9ZZZZ